MATRQGPDSGQDGESGRGRRPPAPIALDNSNEGTGAVSSSTSTMISQVWTGPACPAAMAYYRVRTIWFRRCCITRSVDSSYGSVNLDRSQSALRSWPNSPAIAGPAAAPPLAGRPAVAPAADDGVRPELHGAVAQAQHAHPAPRRTPARQQAHAAAGVGSGRRAARGSRSGAPRAERSPTRDGQGAEDDARRRCGASSRSSRGRPGRPSARPRSRVGTPTPHSRDHSGRTSWSSRQPTGARS